jgi:hypothetical protein
MLRVDSEQSRRHDNVYLLSLRQLLIYESERWMLRYAITND